MHYLVKWISGRLDDFVAIFSFLFLTPIAYLVPKNEKGIVVFSPEGGAFADNSKYAYLALSERSELEVTYVTFNREVYEELLQHGVTVVFYPSLRAMWLMLRARLAIGLAFFPFRRTVGHFTAAAVKFQLWHGSGVKAFGLMRPSNRNRAGALYYRVRWYVDRMFPDFDVLFFSSIRMREMRAANFRAKSIQLNGLLRNDVLFGRKFDGREFIGCDIEAGYKIERARADGRRILIYAPTFRSRSRSDIGTRIPFDFEQMDAFLRHTKSLLVVKLHPHMKDKLDFSSYPNIVEYDRARDIYPYLSSVSIMITDLSSFATDFALLERPILRYIPDYDKSTKGGGIQMESAAELPGQIYLTFADLMNGLIHGETSPSAPHSFFHDFRDDQSCNRLVVQVRRVLQ